MAHSQIQSQRENGCPCHRPASISVMNENANGSSSHSFQNRVGQSEHSDIGIGSKNVDIAQFGLVCQEDVIVDEAAGSSDGTSSANSPHSQWTASGVIGWSIVAAGILSWWICTIALRPIGYGWVAQTVIAWFALILIASSFISVKNNKNLSQSNPGKLARQCWSDISRCFRRAWFLIPYPVQLALGCVAVVGVFLVFIYGFRDDESSPGPLVRARPLLGVFTFQTIFCITSEDRSKIRWSTVILGLILQQLIALFVLKTRAGFDIFRWVVTTVYGFFGSDLNAKIFVWNKTIVDQEFFIVNIVAAVLFFMATVELLYYIKVMDWILKKLAWIFFHIMNISGAEAVVAASSPIVGQGDAACLVKPYMNLMTRSELHLVLTSGYSTISGTFVAIYISLGVPAQNLITSSVMSIPAVIAVSKMRCPEVEEPVTIQNVVINRGEHDDKPNALHAFLKGAVFGLYISGQIIANTLVFLSLLSLVNSLLTWIGLGFGLHQLTLQLILGYIFYPLTYLIGIPNNELLPVARLLATKFVANELVAYTELQALMKTDAALSERGYTITTYALCGFANVSSLAVTGVIGALAPKRAGVAAKIAFSALVCGFLTTMQTAAIVAILI